MLGTLSNGSEYLSRLYDCHSPFVHCGVLVSVLTESVTHEPEIQVIVVRLVVIHVSDTDRRAPSTHEHLRDKLVNVEVLDFSSSTKGYTETTVYRGSSHDFAI